MWSLPWYPLYLTTVGLAFGAILAARMRSYLDAKARDGKKRAHHYRSFKRSLVTGGVTCKCGSMFVSEIISARLCMGPHFKKHNFPLFPMLLVELSMTYLILLGSRCPFSFQTLCGHGHSVAKKTFSLFQMCIYIYTYTSIRI